LSSYCYFFFSFANNRYRVSYEQGGGVACFQRASTSDAFSFFQDLPGYNAYDRFGDSIDVDDDALTLVVGATGYDDGSVQVFAFY